MTNGDAQEFEHLDMLADRLGVGPLRARRSTARTPEGRVSMIEWGDGPPQLALLHGGGLNAHAWDSVAALLDIPLHAIDLPGHGDSDWRIDADYRAAALAPTVAKVVPAHRPLLLVGHSLGGLTALALLAHLASDPTGLVLVDIAPSTVASDVEPPPGVFAGGMRFSSREAAADWAIENGLGRNRESVRLGVRFNTRERADGTIEFKHHLAHLRVEERLMDDAAEEFWAALAPTVPTLLVRGSRGLVTDAEVEELAARAPWVRVAEVEAGHNVHSQAAPQLARLLRDFFASLR